MRIVSWNVNGLRACCAKGFTRFLARTDAHVVAIQELRARPEQLPRSARAPRGWHASFHAAERPGYSGVALYSRSAPDEVRAGIGVRTIDVEGRIQILRLGALTIANSYFPNGNGYQRDLSRIPYKLRYYRRVLDVLSKLADAGEPVLLMGDFNVAHEEIDLARPRENRQNSGFRPEERRAFARFVRAGWVDTFRAFEPSGGHYTWWSQRRGVREKNIGWRLDYILASPAAMPFVRGAQIHPDVRGSDHVPVSVELDPAIVSGRCPQPLESAQARPKSTSPSHASS